MNNYTESNSLYIVFRYYYNDIMNYVLKVYLNNFFLNNLFISHSKSVTLFFD